MVITNCITIEIMAMLLLKKKDGVDILKNNGNYDFVVF